MCKKISTSIFKKQIENIFLFERTYELAVLERHTKQLKLLDANFVEKQSLKFGEATVHEVLYYCKNENTSFLIVLRSDNCIYFHDAIKPEVFVFVPIPKYQNCLLFNSK